MNPDEKAWEIWVEYCRKVKAWYAEGQREPWGMNPPPEQIVDATLAQDEMFRAALTRAEEAEGKLCRAREFISNAEYAQPGESIRALLVISESPPCRHAAIAEQVEKLPDFVDQHLTTLTWTTLAKAYEKELVAGNLRGFARAAQKYLRGEG